MIDFAAEHMIGKISNHVHFLAVRLTIGVFVDRIMFAMAFHVEVATLDMKVIAAGVKAYFGREERQYEVIEFDKPFVSTDVHPLLVLG